MPVDVEIMLQYLYTEEGKIRDDRSWHPVTWREKYKIS